MTPLSITFLVVAGIILVVLYSILRGGKIREKYVGLWGVVGVIAAVLALWPQLLATVSQFLGFQLPVNLLFFAAILLLLGVSLHLSYEVSRLEDETRILAEEVAMLWEQVGRPDQVTASTPQPPEGRA